MAEKNILLKALDIRWRKLRKEWDRTRSKYSEDAVHDLRVASRRLIAVLETLQDVRDDKEIRDCRRRVKKLLDGLSPLRDLHVQHANISRLAQRFPQLESFEKSLAEKEDRTAQKVQKGLKETPKLDRAVSRARRHAAKRIDNGDILKVIDRRYRKVLNLAARVDSSNTTTIHQMRLAFKKFRYTCEVAQPIIKKDVNADRLQQFHDFQTMMGEIQDVEVLTARLSKWAQKNEREADMQPVFEELKSEREKRTATFVASVDQVRTFWKPGLKK
jgi:CHAD domain-containing protein